MVWNDVLARRRQQRRQWPVRSRATALNRVNRRKAARLRTVSELFGEIVDSALDDNTQPSCSAAEALQRQHPFINQTLAQHALALLSRLFRGEPLSYHGGFVNLASGSVVPLRADPAVWKRIHKRARQAQQSALA